MPSTPFDVENLCVQAGAGAGKTTRLTQRVLDFAQEFKSHHGHFPRIAVSTFTRKATQELRERLLLRSLESEELADFVRSRHLLSVSTLHGLMDSFLRTHGSRVGLSPQFRILGDQEGQDLKRKILRRALRKEARWGELLREMSFSEILAHLADLHAAPPGEKSWSFFSAGDQEEIARKKLLKILSELMILARTLEELSLSEPWQEFAASLKGLGALGQLTWPQAHQGLQDFLEHSRKPALKRNDDPELKALSEKCADQLKELKKMATPGYSFSYWEKLENAYQILEELSEHTQRQLKEELFANSQVLLSDLENLTFDVIGAHPEAATEFGSRWDYWLIDEYQDTSPIQVKILKAWMGERPFYVVGDPQQSIYLFRGARREVFFEMMEAAEKSGRTEFISINYRSDPSLLEFINETTLRMKGFERMLPKEPAGEGEWVAALMPSSDEEEEWLQLKSKLFWLLEEEGVRPDQICILGRTKKDLQVLGENLEKANLPFVVSGGSSFMGRRVVRDVCAVLKFLLNPWDDLNLMELLRSPWIRCSDEKLQEVLSSKGPHLWSKLQHHKDAPFVQTLEKLLLQRREKGLMAVLHEFCAEEGLFSTSGLLDPTGTREANLFKIFHRAQVALQRPGINLLEVLGERKAQSLDSGDEEADALSTLEPNRIQLMTYHKAKGLEADYVFLPFLHKRPFLEPWLKMTLDEKRCQWGFRMNGPGTDQTEAHPAEQDWIQELHQRQLEEEQRVFYVGLTRAKKKLFLSWNQSKKVPLTAPASLFENLPPDPKIHKTTPLSQGEKERLEALNFKGPEASSESVLKPWQQKAQASSRVSVTEQISQSFRHSSVESLSKGLRASFRGEKVHRLFELLKMSDAPTMKEFMVKWFGEDLTSVQNALKFVRDLQVPPLGEILDGGKAEWSFLVEKDGYVLEGQIDLFGRDQAGKIWVIDYKSGSSTRKDQAFEQLQLYAQALLRAGLAQKDEPIFLGALYPFEEKVFIESYQLS